MLSTLCVLCCLCPVSFRQALGALNAFLFAPAFDWLGGQLLGEEDIREFYALRVSAPLHPATLPGRVPLIAGPPCSFGAVSG